MRDAKQALSIASELNAQAKGQHPIILDALAASQAATDDFTSAADTARRAIEILDAASQNKMSAEVTGRLRLYEQQKRFVQSD